MKPKTTFPRWSTKARQTHLVKLWSIYGNQCLLGHTACPVLSHYVHYDAKNILVANAKAIPCVDTHGNPLKDSNNNQLYYTVYPLIQGTLKTKQIDRLYELKSENLIKDWIADDRSEALADYKAEHEARHKTNDRTFPLHGKFSGTSKDIYYDQQSAFYVEALGVSGINFHPFAKVRLASSNIRLFVDLKDIFNSMSKNKTHKVLRYGRLNWNLQNQIDSACYQAVKTFLDNRN